MHAHRFNFGFYPFVQRETPSWLLGVEKKIRKEVESNRKGSWGEQLLERGLTFIFIFTETCCDG